MGEGIFWLKRECAGVRLDHHEICREKRGFCLKGNVQASDLIIMKSVGPSRPRRCQLLRDQIRQTALQLGVPPVGSRRWFKRDHFCPVVTRAVARRRRASRMRKMRQRLIVAAGLVRAVAASVSKDLIPHEYAEALKATFAGRSYYGRPEYECEFCHAVFWYQERVKKESAFTKKKMVYNLCCKAGKVSLPSFKDPPPLLAELLRFSGPPESRTFLRKIRQYNSLFSFTSMGAAIDRSVNRGGGPTVFRISGQICHRIGSLLPHHGNPPKFAQLYIYDTANEVANRFRALDPVDGCEGDLDPAIAAGLLSMLDEVNPLVQQFRIARDRLADHGDEEIGIRIVGATEDDPIQFSLPTTSQLAGLIVGDFSVENYRRDVIVHAKVDTLHRVSPLHPAYMPLQYPLLFPYGERGFQLGIHYRGVDISDPNCRVKVTMQDYYCYRCHYKKNQFNLFLCCGRLSEQSKVDGYACVEESRLTWIANNQDEFRCDYYQGVVDAVGNGTIDASDIGKKRMLPATFTGGRRYMNQNYQDAIAICRVYGCPDWFVTFTCNTKWLENIESLEDEPGMQPSNRADIIVRVYSMKLEDLLGDIKDGMVFGQITADFAMDHS